MLPTETAPTLPVERTVVPLRAPATVIDAREPRLKADALMALARSDLTAPAMVQVAPVMLAAEKVTAPAGEVRDRPTSVAPLMEMVVAAGAVSVSAKPPAGVHDVAANDLMGAAEVRARPWIAPMEYVVATPGPTRCR